MDTRSNVDPKIPNSRKHEGFRIPLILGLPETSEAGEKRACYTARDLRLYDQATKGTPNFKTPPNPKIVLTLKSFPKVTQSAFSPSNPHKISRNPLGLPLLHSVSHGWQVFRLLQRVGLREVGPAEHSSAKLRRPGIESCDWGPSPDPGCEEILRKHHVWGARR